MLRGERWGRPCEGCLDLEVWKNKKRSLEKQHKEIETAPSLLRRHARTVSPPPLPAFVFLPPKHFWPLAFAAVGLRVDDRRKYMPRIVFWRWPPGEEKAGARPRHPLQAEMANEEICSAKHTSPFQGFI